ncbi:MAG: NADH-quinone oxidoreductase subunit C [Verrucomicrobiota bacterium]|nr:NADH-quinone oxidoreductase subunit C [Verrucomicrobiota bacterium]
MNSNEAADALGARFEDSIIDTVNFRNELSIQIKLEQSFEILSYCKDKLDFDYLVDITAVDNLGKDPRYEVVYELYSYKYGCHLRLKTSVSESEREAISVVDLWPTANWHEREAFDMLGITFKGHPDMRRILMWEGYPYYPLRKDFPLAGKASEMPDVAFSEPVPLDGGPFVTSACSAPTDKREPRSREIMP